MEIDVEKLKELRQQKALSMRALADKSGVNYNTVFNLEHGKGAYPKTIQKLAAGLGVEVEELTMSKR